MSQQSQPSTNERMLRSEENTASVYDRPGLNPLNECEHGVPDGEQCDTCRDDLEAFERQLDEEQCAADRRFDLREHDDPYEFEPFFEVAL